MKLDSVSAVFLLLMLALSVPASPEAAKSPEEIEAELKALEAEISKYKDKLEASEGQKSDIEDTLKQNEKGISDLIKKIENIGSDIDVNEDKVSHLTRQQRELQMARTEQRELIEQQIRAAYEIGSQEYLKVLLNQEDPDALARMLVYYDYFNEARAGQITRYSRTLTDLDRVTLELAAESDQLNSNRNSLMAEKSALSLTQARKREILKALVTQIRTTGSEISKLNQDRDRLEQLLERLENSLADLPPPADASPFSEMRGVLTMPVAGKVTQRFGSRRNAGKLTWDGIFIEAAEGEPVHAVHYGRVVFSDWLRGFGLLLIISHGEGYMSLYGHNQVLYRETGDWVTAGDMIATVGDSGGQNKTGLYFEIRIAGKPSDPQNWCVARTRRAA